MDQNTAPRIPNWGLEDHTVQELRPGPIHSDEPEESIRLIPLGFARLRISCLPVIGAGPGAREWPPPEAQPADGGTSGA